MDIRVSNQPSTPVVEGQPTSNSSRAQQINRVTGGDNVQLSSQGLSLQRQDGRADLVRDTQSAAPESESPAVGSASVRVSTSEGQATQANNLSADKATELYQSIKRML
ncbi:hypothetical protein HMF8227_02859 [Saliniradius amylolyticus]|uniref:Uncharacterized protein n=1 Tax=Saliniradius amylolyticus TaxID=2183582 RepID=A0A2S2E6P7_9ALTE|nr:hypothetical protein [Saliniradius amylolyticus]AWL13308.1 hypothetical protein HMF8227_02859 [Saliniradius amylolyticus]